MAVFQRSQRTINIWFGIATVVMICAMGGLALVARDQEPLSVYLAVTYGTIVWGWHVASYYLGFVTGTVHKASTSEDSTQNCSVDSRLTPQRRTSNWKDSFLHWLAVLFPDRFRQAVKASLHHELLIVLFFIIIAVVTLPHPNRWGLWIFLTLWLMHTSAKLNIFFGVRNFQIDFLPEHLHFLEQFIAKRSSNIFFPISICIASSVALFLLYQVIDPAASAVPGGAHRDAHSAGATMIGTMILLGILEHWLLVLPIPVALWGWGVRQLPNQAVEG